MVVIFSPSLSLVLFETFSLAGAGEFNGPMPMAGPNPLRTFSSKCTLAAEFSRSIERFFDDIGYAQSSRFAANYHFRFRRVNDY